MSLDIENALAALPAELQPFRESLLRTVRERQQARPHGRAAEWDAVLEALPQNAATDVDFTTDTIRIGHTANAADTEAIRASLQQFRPWRKGPWSLLGIDIDTEWRSDWKWARLAPHLAPLEGRLLLDVGAGNGYYMLRALGAGARFALGVDPTLLFLYQFAAVRRLAGAMDASLLPLRGEDLPAFGCFDTVLSMGVLYHRRGPIDHLTELLSTLRPGGELVLETLVIDGDEQEVLVPEDRYAKMANVWFIPSTAALELWLARAGFENIRTVDVTRTTTDEQRATDWMIFQSLADFLDPGTEHLTIEGLPAPTRAIVLANRKQG